jgi:hypothetical protein
VSPHHLFWLLSGKVYPADAAGATFAPVEAETTLTGDGTISGSMLSSLTGLVDRHMTTSKSVEMSSFLGDFLGELRSMMGN